MYKFEIGNIFTFTINAVLGVVSFLMLALFIKSNRIFEWIGRNTLHPIFTLCAATFLLLNSKYFFSYAEKRLW